MVKHFYIIKGIPNEMINERNKDLLRDDIKLFKDYTYNTYQIRIALTKFQALIMRIKISLNNIKSSYFLTINRIKGKRFRVA